MLWAPFYAIGVLKLLSDTCGFAGPLLLHELVVYVDYRQESAWKGYVYSLCLCGAALLCEYLPISVLSVVLYSVSCRVIIPYK